jgi:AcrR family transcriptional regulator
VSDLRPQILEAAKRLFIEKGYHGLAMRQIAETLGVSKAALYYHFKDKEELLLAILDSYLSEIESELAHIEATQAGARARITALVKMILAQPAEQRAVIRLSSQEMAQLSAPARQAFDRAYHRKFLYRIQSMLEDGMGRGELRRIDPGVATWALLGMLYPYFYPAHSGDLPQAREVSAQLVEIYMEGLERE